MKVEPLQLLDLICETSSDINLDLHKGPIVESLDTLGIIQKHFVRVAGCKGNLDTKNTCVIELKDLTEEEFNSLQNLLGKEGY